MIIAEVRDDLTLTIVNTDKDTEAAFRLGQKKSDKGLLAHIEQKREVEMTPKVQGAEPMQDMDRKAQNAIEADRLRRRLDGESLDGR